MAYFIEVEDSISYAKIIINVDLIMEIRRFEANAAIIIMNSGHLITARSYHNLIKSLNIKNKELS